MGVQWSQWYCFDTDALSFIIGGRMAHYPIYASWLQKLPAKLQATTATVVGELYAGAHRSQRRDQLCLAIGQVLQRLTVFDYSAAVAVNYGKLRAQLELAGTRVADNDLQIAATALHHGATLVTGNVRHYARIPGLDLHAVRPQR